MSVWLEGVRGLLDRLEATQGAALDALADAGAATIAQDEESCVVFGMPKEAIKRGGVQRTLPLQHLAREIAARSVG